MLLVYVSWCCTCAPRVFSFIVAFVYILVDFVLLTFLFIFFYGVACRTRGVIHRYCMQCFGVVEAGAQPSGKNGKELMNHRARACIIRHGRVVNFGRFLDWNSCRVYLGR